MQKTAPSELCWICHEDANISLDGYDHIICKACYNKMSVYEKMSLMKEFVPAWDNNSGAIAAAIHDLVEAIKIIAQHQFGMTPRDFGD